ncbi:pentapeptide repeat-containing protein [Halobacillus naozhouensis]|uniref:Pentapeptide repeat-containing protein n=1 Tax=Halobacillus naozhouensis TaxID=554880 RepID=A0ABY8J2F3_9BACI|nr:pentapeptide repeat-containing protein [Halobacillus naozhouensis]WFT76555.1 pentapeptide repeat-containing protein [Halobacillus naozhouensis]
MFDELKSDCKNCFGLCCVALPYAESADFPVNKDRGQPCQHLCANHLCSIHDQLREKGFRGCVTYECFGAGQHVSQNIFNGNNWRKESDRAKEMFAIFPIVQQLHEMLWYLMQALGLKETQSIQASLQKIYEETVELSTKTPEEILELDIDVHRSEVNALLIETSKLYRAKYTSKNKKKRLDYVEANLKGLDLQGDDFRGKLMIAANLSHSDLRKADFIGADLRDANLSGTNLKETLFLTQSQLNSARGDHHTQIPDYLEKPSHWLE